DSKIGQSVLDRSGLSLSLGDRDWSSLNNSVCMARSSRAKGEIRSCLISPFVFRSETCGVSRVNETPAVLERYRLIPLLPLSVLQTRKRDRWPSYGNSHCQL